MGELCHAWTYKPSLLIVIILLSISCMVHCSENVGSIGKVYPRGNHWAVGHLMGKKSLDRLSGSEESSNRDSDYRYRPSTEKDKLLDRYVQPSKLVRPFIRALGGLDNQNQRHEQGQAPSRLALPKTRQWEETDRDRYLKQLTDLIRLAFKMKENTEDSFS
ncbi:unnamed protein product [Coregonus sp. 'balchen']|nr:unnamed protein product [Coregonus sp. 'balchen']